MSRPLHLGRGASGVVNLALHIPTLKLVALKDIGPVGFWSMMIFLGILVVGFVYEWKKGALDWE